MSDLLRGDPAIGTSGSTRPQNGGTRPVQGTGATTTEPPRYRTPTEVMTARREREARRAAAEEAARREREQESRRQREEVVGVENDPRRRVTQPTQSYSIGGPSTQQTSASVRRPEAPPAVPAQQQTTSQAPRVSSNIQRNRTEAYENLHLPATARAPAQQPAAATMPSAPLGTVQPQQPSAAARLPQPTQPQQPQAGAGAQPRQAFPHAFERWETLSSHWEGLTSYWIHRLEQNNNEFGNRPIDQQMSRQVADLSAAGANLFHAVVELQRLRASSERKFQRWFFETKNEQQQSEERIAQLERQLQDQQTIYTQHNTSLETLRNERNRAEELLREMRRELQISKEEARRAWEELGRREQEERERTIALRSGEPTQIGGVQVVPMQGIASRSVSTAQRPQTRDGPYAGGPGPTMLGGQQEPFSRSQTSASPMDSPGAENRQFTYRPHAASPTVTDPAPEGSRTSDLPLRHEPDMQFYGASTAPSQPPTSAAAIASRIGPAISSPPIRYQVAPTTSEPGGPLLRTGTGETGLSEGRSYVPSTAGSYRSEEEYHINPDGSYTRDAQGRRIPYNAPIGEDDDDAHFAAALAREQMEQKQQQYVGSPVHSQPQSQVASSAGPQTTAGNVQTQSFQQASSSLQPRPTYDGSEYDTRHRHPTRLSDILEEQTTRTSPSRTSYSNPAA